MITEYDVHKAYVITKAHFNSKTGLQYKKRMKNIMPREKWLREVGGQIGMYRHISNMHSTLHNVYFGFAVNFLHDKTFFVANYDHDLYNHHMKIVSAIYKYFCDDLDKITPQDLEAPEGQMPAIVRKVIGGHVSYETAFVVNHLSGWLSKVDADVSLKYIWEDFKKRLLDYGCFLNIENFERFEKRYEEFINA